MNLGLYIRKSQQKDEWILYNPDSFETCHTHCRHKRVAVKIKYLVEHHIVPQSHDIRFVDSCIRVTKNKHYLSELRVYVQTIFLRLNRKTGTENTAKAKNTVLTQSSRWGCLWMATGSLLRFYFSRETQMNRLP